MKQNLLSQESQRKTLRNIEERGSQSEQQQLNQQEQELRKQIRSKKRIRQNNSKMVVGTGFSFDITEFFKFHHKKKEQGQKQVSIFDEISGGHLAWFILFYSICNAAMIPPWIMSIKASKLLRISWRFLLQAIMVIPLMLYQRRSATPEVKQKYTLKNILTPKHIGKLYLSAFATTFWFSCILTCFQWTYISHAMVLGSLSNFFLSLGRSYRKANHELEPGGQVLVVIGILLIFQDSFSLDPELQNPKVFDVINPFYLQKTWVQRILADIASIGVAFAMSKFSTWTSDLKNYYPPFLSMGLVNIIICINMSISAYFFNGATFDYDSKFGVFGIFSQTHFASFMYMAIILCLGLMISFLMISKLFPQPIIPALAMVLQPIVSTFFVNLVGVQGLPGSFACIGYIFIVPGVFLILVGQCMYQRAQKNEQIQQKVRLARLLQLKELRKEQHDLKKKSTQKQVHFQDQNLNVTPKSIQQIIRSPDINSLQQARNNAFQLITIGFQEQVRKSEKQAQISHKQHDQVAKDQDIVEDSD